MARYDIETLLYEIKDFVSNNLNTKLQAITTEKGDSVTIPDIPAAAYAVQSVDDKIMNFPSWVLIETFDIRTVGTGPSTSKDYAILVMVVVGGTQNQGDQVRKVLRYGRALEEIFEQNYDKVSSLKLKLKVESIPPQDYTNLNGTKRFRTIGVILSGTIA